MKSQKFKAEAIAKSAMLASEILGQSKVIDQNAETIEELAAKLSMSCSQAAKLAKINPRLERVYKRSGNRLAMAYRVKQ